MDTNGYELLKAHHRAHHEDPRGEIDLLSARVDELGKENRRLREVYASVLDASEATKDILDREAALAEEMNERIQTAHRRLRAALSPNDTSDADPSLMSPVGPDVFKG